MQRIQKSRKRIQKSRKKKLELKNSLHCHLDLLSASAFVLACSYSFLFQLQRSREIEKMHLTLWSNKKSLDANKAIQHLHQNIPPETTREQAKEAEKRLKISENQKKDLVSIESRVEFCHQTEIICII